MKQTFLDWKRQVESKLIGICGMESDDIPDYDYYTDYHNDRTPMESAWLAFKNAKVCLGL